MSDYMHRRPTLTEIRLKKANQTIAEQAATILDTQEVAAALFEANTSLTSQMLDTQAIVATLAEGGTV